MPNRLELPAELQSLIEKRVNAQRRGEGQPVAHDRRTGDDRRSEADDREVDTDELFGQSAPDSGER